MIVLPPHTNLFPASDFSRIATIQGNSPGRVLLIAVIREIILSSVKRENLQLLEFELSMNLLLLDL